ncbi:MAG: hypothetical protein FJW78_05665 [Actinobacteria bacterium]|nr:hypothetical protein [Actinomycetota bacterium]
MKLYHGSHRATFVAHLGLCLAEDIETARHYAGEGGKVFEVEIDLDPITYRTIEGYDRETNEAPADSSPEALADEHGVDAVWFADEDPHQRRHDTFRLLTQDAVDAILSVTEVTEVTE